MVQRGPLCQPRPRFMIVLKILQREGTFKSVSWPLNACKPILAASSRPPSTPVTNPRQSSLLCTPRILSAGPAPLLFPLTRRFFACLHLDSSFSLFGTHLEYHFIRDFSDGPPSHELACYLYSCHQCLKIIFICLHR